MSDSSHLFLAWIQWRLKKKKKKYQTILKEQKVLKEKGLCYDEQLVASNHLYRC